MTKNPVINALAAILYIAGIASMIFYAEHFVGPAPKPSVIMPITFLSLFTFSAALMGYIFLYQPFQLYFEGKKKEAVNLFLKTVAAFGVITLIALTLLFSRALG